jgi:predicted dehydrogenase
VPTAFSGELVFDDGLTADFFCSFLADFQQRAKLSGPLGTLAVDDFVLPREGPETAFELHPAAAGTAGGRITVAEQDAGVPPTQEAKLFHHFAAQVRRGTLDESWPDLAWKTQRVMAACFASSRDGSRPHAVD